jgi:hypothetical protein
MRFDEATDDELRMLSLAIDALVREQPDLIRTDRAWTQLVHDLGLEVIARRRWREALALRARREEVHVGE